MVLATKVYRDGYVRYSYPRPILVPQTNRSIAQTIISPGITDCLAYCPHCKAMQTVQFQRESLIPTRKFHEAAGRVWHDCGSPLACGLITMSRG